MNDWAQPCEVSDLDLAFGANAMAYMPPRDECEAALKALPSRGREWREFQQEWFFNGLPPDTEITPRKGVDLKAAIRHLRVIQGSFEPKHEHKEAAVAYLASRWFKKVRLPKHRKAA